MPRSRGPARGSAPTNPDDYPPGRETGVIGTEVFGVCVRRGAHSFSRLYARPAPQFKRCKSKGQIVSPPSLTRLAADQRNAWAGGRGGRRYRYVAPPPTQSLPAGSAPRTAQASSAKRQTPGAITPLGIVVAVGFVYYVVPQIAGLRPTLRRPRDGDPGGWRSGCFSRRSRSRARSRCSEACSRTPAAG